MTKMTKADILAMVAFLKTVKPYYDTHYIKGGKVVAYSVPRIKYPQIHSDILHTLASDKTRIFTCGDCGKSCTYADLEAWTCDFDNDDYICSHCYEDAMGDDL